MKHLSQTLKRLLPLSVLSASFLLSGCYFFQHPDLNAYQDYVHRTDPYAEVARQKVNVTFLGTTTLYFDDGETRLMIDGFFTRPGNLAQLALGKIETDKARVKDYLKRLGITHLDVMPIYHSHHDHAMDAAEIARLTGAKLLGSRSTAMIAKGAGLPPEQMIVAEEGKPYHFGKFTITMLKGKHVHLPAPIEATGMMGKITEPLKQPTSVFNYREGETYSILIQHPLGTSLLNSGDFIPGALKGYHADTVFLCTPGIPEMSPQKRAEFFKELLYDTGASRVVPVHWDDFFRSLDEPIMALPRFAEDLDVAMSELIEASDHGQKFKLEFLPIWKKIPLFSKF